MMRKCIVVIGMHRSGTSALMGVLSTMGIDLGSDLMNPTKENPKGYFENMDIYRLNDEILKSLDSSWDDPYLLPENWWKQEYYLNDYKKEIIGIIETEFKDKDIFGIKDPRICRLLPFWKEIFKRRYIKPYFIIILRNPLEIANSLKERDGFSHEKSMLLWMNHMLEAELHSRDCQRSFVFFDELLKNPEKTINNITDIFDIKFPKDYDSVKDKIEGFLEQGLKHHTFKADNIDKDLSELIFDYYHILLSLTRKERISDEELSKIDDIRERFLLFHRFFYNEDIRESKHAYIKDLKTGVKDRDTHIGNIEAALNDRETAIRDKDNQIGNLEAVIGNRETVIRDKEIHIGNLEAAVKDSATVIKDRDTHIGNIESALREKETVLREKVTHIGNLDVVIGDKNIYIGNLEGSVRQKEEHIGNLEAAVGEKDAHIVNIENIVREKEAYIEFIHLGHGWRLLTKYFKIRDWLLPVGAIRRKVAKFLFNQIQFPLKIYLKRKDFHMRDLKEDILNSCDGPQEDVCDSYDSPLEEETEVYYNCDCPSEEEKEFNSHIALTGWAAASKGIDRVEIYCDNVFLGNALYGLLRHDVQDVYPFIDDSERSGFHYSVNDLDIGQHTLTIKIITKDGKTETIIKEVVIKPLDWTNPYKPSEGSLVWMNNISKSFPYRPSITVCIITDLEEENFLKNSIESIVAQSYPFWSLYIFCSNSMDSLQKIKGNSSNLIKVVELTHQSPGSLNEILCKSQDDFICFLRPGDKLLPHAFYELIKTLNLEKELDLIYTDEELSVDGSYKAKPFFKPDWSPDLLLSMNYIGTFFLLRKELFAQTGGLHDGVSLDNRIYDLLLRVTEHTENIGHIPLVLHMGRSWVEISTEAGKKILEECLERRDIDGEVVPLACEGTYRVKRKIIGNPKVSIIIPTAYKKPDFLRTCLRSIAEKSTYQNYEIVLMDNSCGKFSLQELEQLFPKSISCKHIKYEEPFNFSRVNNLAAEKAEGDYLILLNDDVEVITPEWIEAMLEHAQHPDIGVVGAKLLYQDGTIQHGGVFLVDNGGSGRHAFRFLPRDDEGYWGLMGVNRNCSAVTFACAMISKEVFSRIGGLDEKLVIECNDVDFCLRAIRAGYLIVWTPFSILYHRELTTRGATNCKDDIAQHWNRWRRLIERGDPYYNPNLSLDSDYFYLNTRPVLIEHHVPYLTNDTEIKYQNFTHIIPESVQKILVIKLDHIGDIILSLPAVKMLRDKFPGADITMLVGKWAKPIVDCVREVNRVLTFDLFYEKSEEGQRALGVEEIEQLESMLQPFGFDIAIDLRRHGETREVLKLAGAHLTVGYCTGEDDECMDVCLEVPEEVKDIPLQHSKPHIAAQLCQLVDAIPVNGTVESKDSTIMLPDLCVDKDRLDIDGHSDLFEADFLVGVHPGAGSSIRQWPISHFACLADLLIERDNARIIVFGGKGEVELVSQMIKQMKYGKDVVSLSGKISLEEFMLAVKYCHLFVGNVSGPCHIAGVMGVPTLNVFAGQVLPHEWQPLGEKTMTVRVKTTCSPCYKSLPEQCPYDVKCLKLLWPEKVLDAVYQLLTVSGYSEKIRLN